MDGTALYFDPSYNIDNNWKFCKHRKRLQSSFIVSIIWRYGNKELKPEQSNSFETGVQYASKKLP